ncbi:MAG: class I SAM-dependent methyltransferase [Planctomycetes bacterium]|nr:class I SAM-dependent methyltransferase [Planctomycetota bacterium]
MEKTSRSRPWYYAIELAPGEETDGQVHGNLALSRSLLRGVNLNGQACLDLGSMEGVMPTLMCRAGARPVVSYDRLDLSERIERVRKAYGVSFDYIGGLQLAELPAELDRRGKRFFDVVNFSGVMYHAINPLGLLGLARGFCRTGGLFLVETAVKHTESPDLYFNAGGKLYEGSTYFVPSISFLDYALRMLRLEPLGCRYLRNVLRLGTGVTRAAVLCRSLTRPCPLDPGDDWIGKPWIRADFQTESHIDWKGMTDNGQGRPEVPIADPRICNVDARSLYHVMSSTERYVVQPWEGKLGLDQRM